MTQVKSINDTTAVLKPLKFVERDHLLFKIIPLLFILGGVVGFMRLFELTETAYKVLQYGSVIAQFFLIGQAFWYSFRVSYTNKVVVIVTKRFKRRSIISFKTIKKVILEEDLIVVDCGYNQEHEINLKYVEEEDRYKLVQFLEARIKTKNNQSENLNT